jgi:hypothetical protein
VGKGFRIRLQTRVRAINCLRHDDGAIVGAENTDKRGGKLEALTGVRGQKICEHGDLTRPLIARRAPPEAHAEDGVNDDQDGRMRRGREAGRSRDESETNSATVPPAPAQAGHLLPHQNAERKQEAAVGTHEHSSMVGERGRVVGHAAEMPPGPDILQE